MTGVTEVTRRGDGTEGEEEGNEEVGEERERGEEEGILSRMGRTGRHRRLYKRSSWT